MMGLNSRQSESKFLWRVDADSVKLSRPAALLLFSAAMLHVAHRTQRCLSEQQDETPENTTSSELKLTH